MDLPSPYSLWLNFSLEQDAEASFKLMCSRTKMVIGLERLG